MCMYAEIKPTVRDTVGINRLSIAWLVDFRVCGNNAILMKLNQIMAIDDFQKHLAHEIRHSLLINVIVSNEQTFLFKIEKPRFANSEMNVYHEYRSLKGKSNKKCFRQKKKWFRKWVDLIEMAN